MPQTSLVLVGLVVFMGMLRSVDGAFVALDASPYLITEAHVELHGQRLEFDESRMTRLWRVHERHRAQADALLQSHRLYDAWSRRAMVIESSLDPTFEDNAFANACRAKNALHRELQLIESEYFDALRRLAPGNVDSVDRLERQHLRERVLSNDERLGTKLAGARVDLIPPLEEVEAIDPRVRRIVRDYELRLDGLVRQLDEVPVTYKEDVDRRLDRLALELVGAQPTEKQIRDIVDWWMRPYEITYEIRELNKATIEKLMDTGGSCHTLRCSLMAWYGKVYHYLDVPAISVDANESDESWFEACNTVVNYIRAAAADLENLFMRVYGPQQRRVMCEHRVVAVLGASVDKHVPSASETELIMAVKSANENVELMYERLMEKQ